VIRRAPGVLAALAVVLALTSCAREVPLRIGPLRLVMGLSLLEVRVWNGSACPADASVAADPGTLEDVAVARYFAGTRDAPAVGAVPAGSHAVSVVVRDAACQVVLYGCTPAIDFATASAVNVTWAAVDPGIACVTGFACDNGACFEPRVSDSGPSDAGARDTGVVVDAR
jgi:hypothetical protein